MRFWLRRDNVNGRLIAGAAYYVDDDYFGEKIIWLLQLAVLPELQDNGLGGFFFACVANVRHPESTSTTCSSAAPRDRAPRRRRWGAPRAASRCFARWTRPTRGSCTPRASRDRAVPGLCAPLLRPCRLRPAGRVLTPPSRLLPPGRRFYDDCGATEISVVRWRGGRGGKRTDGYDFTFTKDNGRHVEACTCSLPTAPSHAPDPEPPS